MTTYLVAIQHPDDYDPSLEDDSMMRDIDELNNEMVAAGVWLFAGGLGPVSQSKSLRSRNGKVIVSDGPYLETREHMGGFWLLKCAGMDEALEWASKAVIACRVPVEVRPFYDEPPHEAANKNS